MKSQWKLIRYQDPLYKYYNQYLISTLDCRIFAVLESLFCPTYSDVLLRPSLAVKRQIPNECFCLALCVSRRAPNLGLPPGFRMSSSDHHPPAHPTAVPPSLLRARPSTLRSTYSHASLRSAAAPAVAIEMPMATRTNIAQPSSLSTSVSSSASHSDNLNVSESYDSARTNTTNAMSKLETASIVPSVANSSATASTVGSDPNRYSSSPSPPNHGVLVVTGEVDTIDADGVVDTIPGEAKAALRDQLRRRLTDQPDGGALIVPNELLFVILIHIFLLSISDIPQTGLESSSCARAAPRPRYCEFAVSLGSEVETRQVYRRLIPGTTILYTHQCWEARIHQVISLRKCP